MGTEWEESGEGAEGEEEGGGEGGRGGEKRLGGRGWGGFDRGFSMEATLFFVQRRGCKFGSFSSFFFFLLLFFSQLPLFFFCLFILLLLLLRFFLPFLLFLLFFLLPPLLPLPPLSPPPNPSCIQIPLRGRPPPLSLRRHQQSLPIRHARHPPRLLRTSTDVPPPVRLPDVWGRTSSIPPSCCRGG